MVSCYEINAYKSFDYSEKYSLSINNLSDTTKIHNY